MQSRSAKSKSAAPSDGVAQPLFRPEVMAARNNLNGEILLARPLSLTLLCWVAVTLVAVIGCFFFLAEYPPVIRVPVSLSVAAGNLNDGRVLAKGEVPATYAQSLTPGTTVVLLCRSCVEGGGTRRVRITGSSISYAISSASSASSGSDQTSSVTLALSAAQARALLADSQSGSTARVEAEISMPRQRLYTWLFRLNHSNAAQANLSPPGRS